jgi:hypothetical protein
MILGILLLVIAAVMATGTLLLISNAGKPRKPITPAMAAGVTAMETGCIVVYILAALKLI